MSSSYAFRYRIIPRVLTDVAHRNIGTTILGKHISMPLGIAPTGLQKWAHSDGECASARGNLNYIYILYTMIMLIQLFCQNN